MSLVQKVKNPKEKDMSMQISSDALPLIGELLSQFVITVNYSTEPWDIP